MIYVIPLGGIETASSRLRVHALKPFIDFSFDLPSKYEKGDVLIIQKVHNPDELRKAQSQGAKVIFDIDDYYWYRNAYRNMVELADEVTVDTEEKAKEILRIRKTVKVIPDCLDWDGTVAENPERDVIGWTGYGNNAESLNPIGGVVARHYTWKLITSTDIGKYVDFPFRFKEWSLGTVDKELAKCEMTAYHLPDEVVGNVKGMHKLLKSWAIGVPCYTSRMPDYVKAMEEAGVGEKYLVDDWSKLENIGFDERCREYAMRYKPSNVAKLWLEVIGELKNESGD